MRPPELGDYTEGAFMIAALRDIEKSSIRGSSSDSRSSVIVEVLWKTDILPTVGIRLLALKNIDDFRNLAGPDKKVHLGQFLGKFFRISLGQATSDDELLDLSFLFEPRDLNDSVDGLSFSGFDEAASINQHNIRIFRFVNYVVMVSLQQTRHDFGINQIPGAAEAHDAEFLFAGTH